MSNLFKYLNLNEADVKLLDPETIQMGEVVDIMQKTYTIAQEGRKKDILANVIAETVALILPRVNAIKGLSKDAKKKLDEEAKELPKPPKMPKEAPKEAPKEQPKEEKPPKPQENPFMLGQVWMNNVINKKMEILYVVPETDTIKMKILYAKQVDEMFYSLELGIQKVQNGDWVLVEKEEKKKETPPPEEEPETIEEIKSAISGLSLLAKMGDDEAKIEIKRLKAKLKNK